MTPTPFPQHLHAFFHDWLRNVSHHTVVSYRDSWRLFLRFVAVQKATSVAKLGLSDLTEVQVRATGRVIRVDQHADDGAKRVGIAAVIERYDIIRADNASN